ncbi:MULTISPECIES: Rab family GTPase [Pyrobaculum]|uniref:Miro domain protein n=2 Tax=Pyrobaculum arsenaticum TaxID=121277 RepID=A4WM97_PYRAR|nr:GTPase domain-containing protein [Pyrobaculum arsenaticum]ABP51514.1 Miro domain protein [Pyrobaculum arsenaticum DSM 13514]MCY0890992.1 GTPase domain-containing protein [Pyrobaculum arsenaticum]NYR16517.1 GTPase domain-containing protein [Pyrobaculum arsenaticum]
MRRVSVAVLGVGGVGKTTYVFRLLGLSLRPRTTLRPGIYRMYLKEKEVDFIDVPGQLASEVAKNFAKTWTFYVDLMIYMYDLTDQSSLYAIAELHSALLDRGINPYKKVVLIGNKRDLAEELGIFIEGDEIATAVGASKIYYISALKDNLDILYLPLEENI